MGAFLALIPLISAALPVLLNIIQQLEAAAAPGSPTASALSTFQTQFDALLTELQQQLQVDANTLWPFVVGVAALFGATIPPKAPTV